MQNPLLDLGRLPHFDCIEAAHVAPAVLETLAENRAALARLLEQPAPAFASLIEPMEQMQHRLMRVWSPVSHLNAVANNEAMRVAYNTCLPLLTEYSTEIGQNEVLYRAYRSIAEDPATLLDATQRRLLEHALRDFRLAGVGLPEDSKARYKAIMQELVTLQARFEENVLDCMNAWTKVVAAADELAGVPPHVIARARESAAARGIDGWLLTLDQPNYVAVITHADSESLRREFYEAWQTRAAPGSHHDARWDNTALIEAIVKLRHEAAGLIGYRSFAALSLATKMAKSGEEVLAFLSELAEHCVPVARREFAELAGFAGRPLNAWDIAYYSERLQQQRHHIADEELRPYFPLPRVLAGLFRVAERLYGIRIRERAGIPVWHADARYFDVLDGTGQVAGGFYLDAFARPNKRSGAWMDECVGHKRIGGAIAAPVAYLVCNFSPPIGGRPSLLTHDEVLTLFHEFGHGLHHLLTTVPYPSLAGINGVPWDAVELPSQFMENYAWSPEVLGWISGHFETGAALPEEKLRRLLGTRAFLAGLQSVRQLEFALFDFRLHSEFEPGRGARAAEIIAEVRARVAVVPHPPLNRFANSFTHIFSGGYAAGYYSYKWAEVLAADVFAAFEESGIFTAEVARRFLGSILSRGGSRDALEAFVEFRGRKPDIRPLLRQNGIAA
ncbi:MAG TPA: M3 family metallopeptidase [Steroidobacteraceae bacterium]|nr:M3 family metallopeptidase [Steroidobacteraceae bacterium]